LSRLNDSIFQKQKYFLDFYPDKNSQYSFVRRDSEISLQVASMILSNFYLVGLVRSAVSLCFKKHLARLCLLFIYQVSSGDKTQCSTAIIYFCHHVLPADKTRQPTCGLLPGWRDVGAMIICSSSAFVGATVH
jgi:hypothetical protein